ncbi:U32 family peptidase, partial [Salmonella enterica]|nr:U32 family peptidase [Salmonella enterica]
MRQQTHYLELLSPARDAAIAREAILHGADAVYIGGPGFGARHNASNSLRDIADLVPFAHRYGARIFVTLNTILHDDELEPAQRLITDLYNTGVDALIVQDMGILELDIPPIELHASTQCDIRSVEKAKFLADVGFSQIVLARELNLSQIAAIHQATDATIEFFIHGALCVAYSGQCYISHAQTGRSANRGDCSQACRLPYTLKDDQGRVVSYEKHLLSMKDNDQTANLGALIDAGVRSFKIEGRYKDMSYVKNITAHYRQMLDAIIEQRGDLARASVGRTEHFFVPSTEKTFHRGSTDYFVNARKGDIGAFDSPKFIGLPVGEVLNVAKDYLDVEATEPLANGDGLNVLIKREVVGFRANTVEKTGHNRYRVWPNDMPADLHKVRPHHPLNRNLDHNWQQALTKTSSERRVAVDIMLGGWQEQLILTLTSEDGVCITHTLDGVFEEANNSEKALNNLTAGLAKLGQTPYYARDMQVTLPAALFVPNSLLNQFRREAIDMLDAARLAHYQRGRRKPVAQPA